MRNVAFFSEVSQAAHTNRDNRATTVGRFASVQPLFAERRLKSQSACQSYGRVPQRSKFVGHLIWTQGPCRKKGAQGQRGSLLLALGSLVRVLYRKITQGEPGEKRVEHAPRY